MTVLPWQPGTIPLMLAPMQGLTNQALRAYFIEHVRPDVIFTEFMRVNTAPAGAGLTAVDLREIKQHSFCKFVIPSLGFAI